MGKYYLLGLVFLFLSSSAYAAKATVKYYKCPIVKGISKFLLTDQPCENGKGKVIKIKKNTEEEFKSSETEAILDGKEVIIREVSEPESGLRSSELELLRELRDRRLGAGSENK